jgi:cytochrome b
MTSSERRNKPLAGLHARIRVWDWPIRVFHWGLALCVVVALVTGTLGGGWMVWHGRAGLAIAGLLVFRLAWSLWGSTYARFDVRRLLPGAIRQDIRGEWQGHGHSPLGSLSVLAMLMVLSAQVMSGLMADDDIAFRGPWADAVTGDVSAAFTAWHHRLSTVVMLLVGLHVTAIVWYQWVRRRDVLRPMVRGWAVGDPSKAAQGGGRLALAVAITVAVLGGLLASGEWRPEPPPAPPATNTPDW